MEEMQVIRPILNRQILQLPFYITAVGLNFWEKYIIDRVDGSEEYQISVCVGGSGVFECGGMKYEINEHDVFWFAPHVPHCYYPVSKEPWQLSWVIFNGQNVEPLYQNGIGILRQIGTVKIASGIGQIYSQLRENNIYNHLEASKALYALQMELVAYQYGFYRKTTSRLKLEPVIVYMEQHFAKDISLEELAQAMGVSVSYLCRTFRAVYQISPLQYLIQLRMNQAKQLMLTFPKMPVREVAERCGYKDVSYFTAEFKRNTGFSPAAYRNRE